MRASFLRGVNSSLAIIERDDGVPGLLVDFSNNNFSMQLNVFFNSSAQGMLDEKYYRAVHIIFSIIEAYIDRAVGFLNDLNTF